MIMKITMLSTQNGSIDGIRVTGYAQGATYDLTDSPGARSLATAFVGAAMAVEVPPTDLESAPSPQDKAVGRPQKAAKPGAK